MENLQFIDIITNNNTSNTPEEIQSAFVVFMRFCQEHHGGPAQFEDILFIHEILSAYTFRRCGWRTKKKSDAPHLCLRGVGRRRGPYSDRGVQNALPAGGAVRHTAGSNGIRIVLEPRIRETGTRGDALLARRHDRIPEQKRPSMLICKHRSPLRGAPAHRTAEALSDSNAGVGAKTKTYVFHRQDEGRISQTGRYEITPYPHVSDYRAIKGTCR